MNLNPWKKVKLVKAYKDVFASEKGQIILNDLIRECGLLRNCYRGEANDLLVNEGKRNVLLYILSNINVDLNTLIELIERQSKGESDELIN
jgi:hypothetical protein